MLKGMLQHRGVSVSTGKDSKPARTRCQSQRHVYGLGHDEISTAKRNASNHGSEDGKGLPRCRAPFQFYRAPLNEAWVSIKQPSPRTLQGSLDRSGRPAGQGQGRARAGGRAGQGRAGRAGQGSGYRPGDTCFDFASNISLQYWPRNFPHDVVVATCYFVTRASIWQTWWQCHASISCSHEDVVDG